MADSLSDFLLDGHRHASINAESLELMGKQAANLYLNEKVPLNETIAKLAGSHADISQEQVKRVAEFANTAVYLARHDQSKTAGADSSYPQFEIADASRIIQELSDGARPTVITATDLDYSKHPHRREKLASVESDQMLNKLFDSEEVEKRAGVAYSMESVASEVLGMKTSLSSVRDILEGTAERMEMAVKQAEAEYYDSVKRHLLNGNSFSEVLAAANSSGVGEVKVAEVLKPVLQKLLAEKVASPNELRDGVKSLEKIAHRVINREHPLAATFCSIVSLEGELDKVAHDLHNVDAQLHKVNSFIKESLLARRTTH